MHLDELSIELLEKFLARKCTPQEEDAVLRYFKESKNEESISALMEAVWEQGISKPLSWNLERAEARYKKVSERIRPTVKTQRFSLFKVAASFLLFSIACIVGYQQRNALINYIDPVSYVHVESKIGQRINLTLPDGSMVWLNASTTIIYPDKFRSGTREIRLTGEAFFKVKRDVSKPFIVHTENFFTQVLGTSFNVKAYSTDNDIKVTVSTGKVSVGLVLDSLMGKSAHFTTLTPGQQALYKKDKKSFSKRDSVPLAPNAGWTDGKLIFKNTPLVEVINTLQRWYGVPIHVEGVQAKGCTFTADFKQSTTLIDALEVLSMTNRLKYNMKNNLVSIYSTECDN